MDLGGTGLKIAVFSFTDRGERLAEKLCDEICIIKEGELLFSGTMDELRATHKASASLENIFLELTDTNK